MNMRMCYAFIILVWLSAIECQATIMETIASSFNTLGKTSSALEYASIKGKAIDKYVESKKTIDGVDFTVGVAIESGKIEYIIRAFDDYTVENLVTVDDVDFTVSVIVKSGKIESISWTSIKALDQAQLSSAFHALIEKFKAGSKNYIERVSSALNGKVVIGELMAHPSQGISFRASLLDVGRKISVDMEYEIIPEKQSFRWNVTAAANVPIPYVPPPSVSY